MLIKFQYKWPKCRVANHLRISRPDFVDYISSKLKGEQNVSKQYFEHPKGAIAISDNQSVTIFYNKNETIYFYNYKKQEMEQNNILIKLCYDHVSRDHKIISIDKNGFLQKGSKVEIEKIDVEDIYSLVKSSNGDIYSMLLLKTGSVAQRVIYNVSKRKAIYKVNIKEFVISTSFLANTFNLVFRWQYDNIYIDVINIQKEDIIKQVIWPLKDYISKFWGLIAGKIDNTYIDELRNVDLTKIVNLLAVDKEYTLGKTQDGILFYKSVNISFRLDLTTTKSKFLIINAFKAFCDFNNEGVDIRIETSKVFKLVIEKGKKRILDVSFDLESNILLLNQQINTDKRIEIYKTQLLYSNQYILEHLGHYVRRDSYIESLTNNVQYYINLSFRFNSAYLYLSGEQILFDLNTLLKNKNISLGVYEISKQDNKIVLIDLEKLHQKFLEYNNIGLVEVTEHKRVIKVDEKVTSLLKGIHGNLDFVSNLNCLYYLENESGYLYILAIYEYDNKNHEEGKVPISHLIIFKCNIRENKAGCANFMKLVSHSYNLFEDQDLLMYKTLLRYATSKGNNIYILDFINYIYNFIKSGRKVFYRHGSKKVFSESINNGITRFYISKNKIIFRAKSDKIEALDIKYNRQYQFRPSYLSNDDVYEYINSKHVYLTTICDKIIYDDIIFYCISLGRFEQTKFPILVLEMSLIKPIEVLN